MLLLIEVTFKLRKEKILMEYIKDKMIKDKLCPRDVGVIGLENYTNECEYDDVVTDCDHCRELAWNKYMNKNN